MVPDGLELNPDPVSSSSEDKEDRIPIRENKLNSVSSSSSSPQISSTFNQTSENVNGLVNRNQILQRYDAVPEVINIEDKEDKSMHKDEEEDNALTKTSKAEIPRQIDANQVNILILFHLT